MPWSNSWSGGAVIASQVQVVTSAGVVVAQITPTGDIIGQNFFVAGDLYIGGTSLKGQLTAAGLGAITWGEISTGLPSFTATDTGIMGLDFTAQPFRVYYIYGRLKSTPGGTSGQLSVVQPSIHYTVDGTTPTVSSSNMETTIWGAPAFGTLGTSQFFYKAINFANIAPIQVRMLLSASLPAGTAPATTQYARMDVLDIGNSNTYGANRAYAAAGAGSVQKSFQQTAFDSQSYQEGGAASQGSGPNNQWNMYFGEDPGFAPNGNWRSYCWFNMGVGGGNGLGSLTDMNGAIASNITQLDVFLTADWFYYVSGGTVFIGYHNIAAANHVSEPGAVQYRALSNAFSGRGQSGWISILNTSLVNAIVTGTFRGIVLGPGPTTDFGYYGYCEGQAQGGLPQIRGTYFK